MLKQTWAADEQCEATLASALQPFATALREYDVVDLIAFSRLERRESLRSLVETAVELFFKPDRIQLLDAGEVHVAWGRTPEIELNFNFKLSPLRLYFRILLSDTYGAVGIDYVDCPAAWRSDKEHFELKLRNALQQARLQPT